MIYLDDMTTFYGFAATCQNRFNSFMVHLCPIQSVKTYANLVKVVGRSNYVEINIIQDRYFLPHRFGKIPL